MRSLTLILAGVFGIILHSMAQDTLVVSNNSKWYNATIADQFTLYESDSDLNLEEFKAQKKHLKKRELSNSVENLDFTSHTFFIEFTVVNQTSKNQNFVLETARPITNGVTLYKCSDGTFSLSGDAIPFGDKTIASNRSVLPIFLAPNSMNTYVLKLTSDGEIISLPMIFWENEQFEIQERNRQFATGIFYGIFLFVIIIYLTFYVLLRDRLFILYTVYVFFSGMLQFVLDGYVHKYMFTSGGYLTQHTVIVVAGLTVFFALQYATRYLELQGKLRKVTLIFAWLAFATLCVSLIPGKIYEICYPLINGFSFIAVGFLLTIAIRIRRTNPKISRLFLLGLFTLMTGAVLFILGNFSIVDIPDLTQNSLKAGTLVEIICLSILMAGKYKSLQEEKEVAQAQLLSELEARNKLVSETNIRLEQEVLERTQQIESQRKQLKEKNDDFVSSVKYAERIQKAFLSNEQKFRSILPNSFVLFKPKDIVSGDFYWIERIDPTDEWPNGLTVYATADCTGHGVPGAFVSIICNNLLKLGRTHKEVQNPGQALDFINKEINQTLNSEYGNEQIRDGMDIALCAIDEVQMVLYFSGAKNGIYIIRDEELIELKGDRHGIGYMDDSLDSRYTTQSFQLQQGDTLYTFSDGYIDQFGGPLGKKLTSRRLKEILLSIRNESLDVQRNTLNETFDNWKGDLEQVDDVLLIRVQID